MECDIWKIIPLQETTASNLIPLDGRRAFWCALFFHTGGQEQLKSAQLLTVDKSVLTDQKTLLLLDMLIYLAHQYSVLLSKSRIQS